MQARDGLVEVDEMTADSGDVVIRGTRQFPPPLSQSTHKRPFTTQGLEELGLGGRLFPKKQ
jgi:hypothetical protein